MIRRLFFPGLLETGALDDGLLAVRDGFVNLYIVCSADGLVCIDAGWRPAAVARAFGALGLALADVRAVFLTHLHWDHARALGLYPEAQLYVGALEVPRRPGRPWVCLDDGESVTAGGVAVQAVGTPGHTPGSMSYVVAGRLLFTGDALRLRHGAAVPFPACFNRDGAAVRRSLRKLAGLAGIEHLLSAHTGATRAVATAFARWRDPDSAPLPARRDPA